jgi:hypothetical protein
MTVSCNITLTLTLTWRSLKMVNKEHELSALAIGKILFNLFRSWRVSDVHYCLNEWYNEHVIPWPTLYLRSVCYLSYLRWLVKLSSFAKHLHLRSGKEFNLWYVNVALIIFGLTSKKDEILWVEYRIFIKVIFTLCGPHEHCALWKNKK